MPTENQSPTSAIYASLTDADTRRRIIADPKKYAEDQGVDVEGKEVRVTTCTKDTLYIPLYQSPESNELSLDELSRLSAGVRASTTSTATSIACIGTACSSFATASSVGTLGSVDPW